MAKITKREYTKARAELDRRIQVAETNLATLNTVVERSTAPPSDELRVCIVDLFNSLTDTIRDLEGDRDNLDDRFNRRNWTSSDYASWSLVCNNCD